jgi:mannose/fructose/N-acetylgalactosamine-specific phosphotransferase system component IIC
MLKEVVPMLRQTLEKAMLDRNYVQLERVRLCFSPFLWSYYVFLIVFLVIRMRSNNISTRRKEKSAN